MHRFYLCGQVCHTPSLLTASEPRLSGSIRRIKWVGDPDMRPLFFNVAWCKHMAVHSTYNLTLPPLTFRRALRASLSWEDQWRRMSPALRGDCLAATTSTMHRLEYLVVERKVGMLF